MHRLRETEIASSFVYFSRRLRIADERDIAFSYSFSARSFLSFSFRNVWRDDVDATKENQVLRS